MVDTLGDEGEEFSLSLSGNTQSRLLGEDSIILYPETQKSLVAEASEYGLAFLQNVIMEMATGTPSKGLLGRNRALDT